MSYSFWSNVGVDVQTVLGSALTIVSITKANPAVVESTAHGLANGDIVKMAVNGMHQLNGRVFRVAGVTTDTFQLEGEDSTTYDTFTSGNAYEVTLGASMTTVQGNDASGGEPEFADVTTIHDQIRRQVPTVTSPMTITQQCLWDTSDPALVELNKASKSITERVVQIRFSSGKRMLFNSYVSAVLVPTGQAQGVVTTPVTFAVQNLPTVYNT